jgi:hypothetical protein
MTIFTRWAIVFKHDKSPLDECLYIHKAKAESKLHLINNKNKFEIQQVALMNKNLIQNKFNGYT